MLIVRLKWKEDPEEVWNCVRKNLKGQETKKVKPLYISKLHDKNYISVVFEVEKIDYIVKFLVEQVGNCQEVGDTQTLTLMKPVFLPIPKERPKNMCRFSIFFKVEPRFYHDVYNELLSYRYESSFFANFVAYSLGDFDIMLSTLGDEIDTVRGAVEEKLSKLKGVLECTINRIEKSEHLANTDTWRRLQKSLLHIPPWVSKDLKKHYLYDYEMSTEDYCKLTGAMIDEL